MSFFCVFLSVDFCGFLPSCLHAGGVRGIGVFGLGSEWVGV